MQLFHMVYHRKKGSQAEQLSACRLLMLHCLWKHECEPEISCCQHFLVFSCLWKRGWRLRCTHTMRSRTCVSVCVACKLRPRPSYSRRRVCIDLVLLHSLCSGGGGGGHWSLVDPPTALLLLSVMANLSTKNQCPRWIGNPHCRTGGYFSRRVRVLLKDSPEGCLQFTAPKNPICNATR